MSSTELRESASVEPLPYQRALRDYLRQHESEIWQWYAAHPVGEVSAEAVRLELLKATYRVERETQADLYRAAEEIARFLGLDVPLTIYQAQNPRGLNASLAFLPNEAHLVLHGSVAAKLVPRELRALLAHELGHLVLWQIQGGDYLRVDQILAAITHDPACTPRHAASARLFALYNEIFCDRVALGVVGDPLVVIGMLVKVHTELEEVSAESYLRQAQEVVGSGTVRAAHVSHPEAFIRACAVQLWHERDPEAEQKIARMIEGPLALDSLDLLGQTQVRLFSRRLIDAFLAEPWMRTDRVLAHARLFFEDDGWPAGGTGTTRGEGGVDVDRPLETLFKTDDRPLEDYYCYVLLDFVTVDRDLEDFPLAWGLEFAERIGLKERFREIARKELSLKEKQLERIDGAKREMLKEAEKRPSIE